jgi:ribosomal protein L11 methyltransferase
VIRLAIRVRREQAELVLAELLELAPAGVEESEPDPRTVEFAIYGAPGELPALPDLDAICAGSLVEISTSELPDDWHERWKEFHRPVLVPADAEADPASHPLTLRIRPPWDAPAPPPPRTSGTAPTQHEIVIDPGQAFGTGGHASTRLCLELLLELLTDGHRPGPLLDVGTGSGVLAIAGGMLGFGPLLGLDHEQESVEAAAVNARVNGVELEVRRYDVRSDSLPWLGAADDAPDGPLVLMANLLRPLLLVLSRALHHPPDELVMGGLLVHEVDEVAAAFAERLGMRERRRVQSGDWAAAWLSGRPGFG